MEKYLAAAGDVLAQADPARYLVARPGPDLPKEDAARNCVAAFARRAFRRPVEDDEVDRLMRLFRHADARGDGFEDAVRLALKAALVSPNFLYLVERDRSEADGPYRVSDHELACRLSYFLWSSMPDEELSDLADAGRLHEPEVLEGQVRRMLADPKSRALAEDFAGQWLRVGNLAELAEPDKRLFPEFTPELRDAMAEEAVAFCHAIFREDRPVLELLDSDYTFLNERLAKHYGIDGVTGPEFRRVALKDRNRGGVLGMAAVLTLTSYPRRTSPVLRGKWVLEELLGTPPPPPPPMVKALPADDRVRDGMTFRQRLEQHRKDVNCASCHARLDPLGFGLENFDVLGRWRDEIKGEPVDASGELTTGEKFAGAAALEDDPRRVQARALRPQPRRADALLRPAEGRGILRHRHGQAGHGGAGGERPPGDGPDRRRGQDPSRSSTGATSVRGPNDEPEESTDHAGGRCSEARARWSACRCWRPCAPPSGALAAAAPGADDRPPVRMACLFWPNGCNPRTWTPEGEGKDYELSPILQPLARHKDDVLVLTRLSNQGTFTGDGHYVKDAAWLTGTTIHRTTGADLNAGGVSMDQLAAKRIGVLTPIPSLELGVEPVTTGVDTNVGYTRLYGSHISWSSPTTPVAREINPKLAFDRLFRSQAGGRCRRRRPERPRPRRRRHPRPAGSGRPARPPQARRVPRLGPRRRGADRLRGQRPPRPLPRRRRRPARTSRPSAGGSTPTSTTPAGSASGRWTTPSTSA